MLIRKLSAGIICLFLLTSAFPGRANTIRLQAVKADNFTLVEQLFSSTGAGLKEIKLKYWGQINNRRETLSELENKYEILAGSLGIEAAEKTAQADSDGLLSISQLLCRQEETIQVVLQNIPLSENEGITVLGLSVQSADKEQARSYYQALQKAFIELQCPEKPGVEFFGIIPKALSAHERVSYLQQLGRQNGARYIEGIDSGNLTSLSFFKPEGTGGIGIAGRMVNLNMAVRSKPAENTSNLHIAMPLILSDY